MQCWVSVSQPGFLCDVTFSRFIFMRPSTRATPWRRKVLPTLRLPIPRFGLIRPPILPMWKFNVLAIVIINEIIIVIPNTCGQRGHQHICRCVLPPLSVDPSVRPSVRPSVPPYVHSSVRPTVRPFVRPSIRAFLRPSVTLSSKAREHVDFEQMSAREGSLSLHPCI